MSTQQDIYAAGFENRPPMLNKENYVPWSSRLLRYAKSRPNGKLIFNSIMNVPYVRRMIPEPGADREVPVNRTFHEQIDDELIEMELKHIEADGQAIQTILLGLPKDIYAARKASCLMNGKGLLPLMGNQLSLTIIVSQSLLNVFQEKQTLSRKVLPIFSMFLELSTRMDVDMLHCSSNKGLAYNRLHSENFIKTPAIDRIAQPGNQNGYNLYRSQESVVQNAVQNLGVQNVGNQNGVIVVLRIDNQNLNGNGNVFAARAEGNTQLLIAQKEEAGIQLQAEEYDLMAAILDLEEIEEVNANCILMANLQQASSSADESLAKQKALELEIERLLREVVSQDIMSIVQNPTVVETSDLQTELERKPPSSSKPKFYAVTPFPKSKGLPKIDETHALSKLITLNSVPTLPESKVMKNDNVIALGMFRINPFKPSREEKYVPNKVRASVRTNLITVSQPHFITKKDINSDSNGLSSIGVDNTAKTKRPQPRSNTKNDRVPSASKSSCSKNKEVEVEEHPRNLLLSKNKKHMSSKCNNVMLTIQNDKSKVVCAMCMQCLITVNHDVCVLNYVNDMNSRGKKQKEKFQTLEIKRNKSQRL
ncbi:hypothetical protein Tco_1578189 [Tanacetum coccineum]